MKKLITVVICVLMIVSSLAVYASAAQIINDKTFKLGDADNDGAVNAKDSFMLKSYIVSAGNTEINMASADIDADNKVTAKDNYCLKSYFANVLDLSALENGKQVYKFTIAGLDISQFGILRPADCTSADNVDLAADLMQKYIRTATGVSVPDVAENDTCKKIVFHDVDYHSEEGQKLGIEGYIYKVLNGDLHIYGTYRGNMYAVYEILEDYLGFRFFDDDYTFLYKSRVVDLPEGTYKFVYPEVPIRNVRANMSNAEEHELALRLNSTDHGGTTDLRHGLRAGSQFINAHSFGYYYKMGTGTMPEEGALNDDGSVMTLEQRLAKKYDTGVQMDEYNWQPCASTDEEYEIMFSGMLDTITRIINWGSYDFSEKFLELGVMSMSFSGCDNIHFCGCKLCNAKANGITVNTNTSQRKMLEKYGGKHTIDGKAVSFGVEGYSGVYIDLSNRAATDLQEYYPGLRVHAILYDHVIPESIRPVKWMNVWYCGTGCNNHWLGSHGCSDEGGQLTYSDGTGWSNKLDEPALIAWGQFCEESGAKLWFWYYPVTYHYYLCGCPNIFNIYYDYKYLVEECGCYNLFYEGGGQNYNFEKLKGYLAARMAWDPHMTMERYIEHIKEFLYMYYGDGYEEMYEYLVMQDEAGNQSGTCFVNNYDRPGDMYSMPYLAEHYEEMRVLLVEAGKKAKRTEYKERISTMLYCFDFLGLSAVYKDWYVNGTNKALYIERCNDMFNYLNAKNIVVFSDPATYTLPAEPDFSVDPMTQIYEDGSRRPDSAWGN